MIFVGIKDEWNSQVSIYEEREGEERKKLGSVSNNLIKKVFGCHLEEYIVKSGISSEFRYNILYELRFPTKEKSNCENWISIND